MQHVKIGLFITLFIANSQIYTADPASKKPEGKEDGFFKTNFKSPRRAANDSIESLQNYAVYTGECLDWAKSAVMFYPSLAYNTYLGQGACSFHVMLAPYEQFQKPTVVIGSNFSIIVMADGKRSPLILGNIPQNSEYLKKVRETCKLKKDARLGLHTMNRRFEQGAVWLGTTVMQDGNIIQYHYSTTDFTAPKPIDLMRGAYNIEKRDERGEEANIVHCKAGKSRSATMACAYELCVFEIAEKINPDGTPYTEKIPDNETVINAIIQYSTACRPCVSLHTKQKNALYTFYSLLKDAGSLENLHRQHEYAIQQREKEVGQQHSSITQQ